MMVAQRLSAFGFNSAVVPHPFAVNLRKSLWFYRQPCNTAELQPGPGLKKGYLKSKGDGGKRERPLVSLSESIYEQSAAMNPSIRAPWETRPALTKPTAAKATAVLVSE